MWRVERLSKNFKQKTVVKDVDMFKRSEATS